MLKETKDMLQPKIFVISKRKIYNVDYISFDVKSYGVTEKNGLCDEYNFNEVFLMLNTGMKDKNGKYIYEDDIVKVNGTWNCIIEYKQSAFVLKSIDDRWSTGYFSNYDDIEEKLEVIGNIYENKELLKC